MDEPSFLNAILDNPSDDALRLVYADWLEEQGDEGSSRKAWYLRVTTEIPSGAPPHRWPAPQMVELRILAARLPTDWLAVVSRLAIENCPRAVTSRARLGGVMQECSEQQWDHLERTDHARIRHCGVCQSLVRYCDTMIQAREHAAQGQPVAVDLAIRRAAGDLLAALRVGESDEPESGLAHLRRLHLELEREALRIARGWAKEEGDKAPPQPGEGG